MAGRAIPNPTYNKEMASLALESALSKLRALQPSLRDEYGVSDLWVFGSYVRGEEAASSDIDVLVEFDRPGMTLFKFVDLEMRLSEHLGTKVDLVQRSALRPGIRPHVLSEAVAV